MSEQKHIIKRQVIELKVQGTAQARQLQREVSRVYRQRIVPLIDRYCTEFSETDRLHRIESLELDLGYVDPGQLETELVSKASDALRKALAAQISEQERISGGSGQSPKTISQMELFAFFASTGSLPWWADVSQPRLLENCLEYLIREAPEALRRLMSELAREQRPLRRIVNHYADRWLASVAGLLAPAPKISLERDMEDLIRVLQKTKTAVSSLPSRIRQSVWTHVLHVASLEGKLHKMAAPFFCAALKRIAVELGTPYNALVMEIHQVLKADRGQIHQGLKDALDNLFRDIQREQPAEDKAIAQLLARLQTAGGPLANFWTALHEIVHRFPAPVQKQLLIVFEELASDVSMPDAAQRSLLLLQPVLADRRIPLTVIQELNAEAQKLLAGEFDEAVAGLARMLHEILQNGDFAPEDRSYATLHPEASGWSVISRQVPGRSPRDGAQSGDGVSTRKKPEAAGTKDAQQTGADGLPIDFSFSDANELYVGNAGLTILWSFLERFFDRLHLLENKQFKDAAARQRAVGLLQVLATAEPVFPEYLLALNKTLCGIELKDVFEFGPPLSEPEAEECTNLLNAVIEQTPILRNMSAEGFRGTFLLRQGILRARDSAWLLQVERETYDVVLDRFPWGWEWVKLPWMDTALKVEW